MKVLFVETRGAPGGAQRSLLELAATLRSRGIDLYAATPPGALADALHAAGIAMHTLPEILPRQVTRWRPAIHALRRILAVVQPDILHANGLPAGLLAFLARPSAPRVLHVRDVRLNPLLLRVAAHRTRAVIAISPRVQKRLAALGVTSILIPNGIDLARHTLAPNPATPPRVAMVAQWAKWKRHDLFLRAAPLVREVLPNTQFTLLPGDSGTDARWEKSMRQLAREHHVEILPFVDDMPRFYATLSVLVHPAADEPFGRVLYESLAAGVPVVARRSPATQDLPPPSLLVDTDTPHVFAAALIQLLRQRTPENIVAWQSLCHATAATFDIASTAEACLALYAAILQPRPR